MRSIPDSELPVWEWPDAAEERALAAELRELERSLELDEAERWGPADVVDIDGVECAEIDDVEVIASILAHGVDPWSHAMLACIDPESFTHPTSERRQRRFTRGYDSGDIDQCATLNTEGL